MSVPSFAARSRWLRALAALALVFTQLMGTALPARAAGSASLTAAGTAYTENFDTLVSTGTGTLAANTPLGWNFAESGTNANTIYTAGTGSNNAGDTYSFGATSASDRAFGGLLSGSVTPTIGASFINNTGSTIGALDIAYTGEQWRIGNTTTARDDRLDFQYSTDATSLTTGTWVDVNSLDFTNPIKTAATTAALDGNASANRTAISGSITGQNIPNGATFWIRWSDFNATGSDDSLAIDDFSLTPQGDAATAPSITTGPQSQAITSGQTATLSVVASGTTPLSYQWYQGSAGDTSAPVGANAASYTTPALTASTSYWVRVSNSAGSADSGTATITVSPATDQPIATGGATSLATTEGSAASAVVTASDPDSTITGATITSAAVTGIALNGFASTPNGSGSDASVSLDVGASVPAGSYPVDIQFANNTGQTASASVAVTVNVPAGSCPTPSTALVGIPALQGTADTNTANGQNRTVRGVVSVDVQGSPGQNGFYLQDPAGDGNLQTSDGVFVFVPSANSAWFGFDVAVGDALQVSGRATEFQGMTEIDTVTSIVKCGTNATIAPATVHLPEATNGELERYEGMLVSIPETLTVQQNFFLGRYGQVTLGVGGRLYQPTNRYDAGSAQAITAADSNARSMIVLDDANSAQNPSALPYIGAGNTLRAGDTTSGLVGALDFGAINSDTTIRDYRLQPTQPVVFTRVNDRTAAPATVGGNLKVASFNVLNYFNGDGQGGGFPTSRGANTLVEFNRQRDKIIAAITAIDPAVAGLMEMENDGSGALSAVQDLVNGLNAATSPGKYALVAEPAPGSDQIKVAMIYQPALVSPSGTAVNYQVGDPTYGAELFDRPPLAQTFQHVATGQIFTVIVNHFKSKGSCPTSGPDTDQGDGQGCWNPKRTRQAQELLGFIGARQAASGDLDVLVIGDLNSYGMEDPIQALTAGGLVNTIQQRIGDDAYSYVFDGMSGYLDHALATSTLDSQISGVTEWHINADEPSVIDYNVEFKNNPNCTSTTCTSPDYYAATPFRASDHDPVLVGLSLSGAPTPTNPSGVGSASPASVTAGSATLLTVAVTPGANPASSGLSVSADLTAIGGLATQAFVDNGTNGDTTAGDNIFSFSATVTAATTAGAKSLPFTVADAQARSGSGTIALTVTAAVACSAPDVAIGSVQGSGAATSASGTVTVQGVVVGDYEGASPALRGFYLQDSGDGDTTTSDGIFVFEGDNANRVGVGQVVQVTGTPGENQGQTQISSTTGVEVCGSTASLTPTDVALPVPAAASGVDYLERFEGMLVRFAQTLYVTEHFQLGRFGQVVLSSGERLRQPTNVAAPGAPALALQAQNDLNKIILDDASQAQNPDPIVFARGGSPLSAANTLRGGDSVANLSGVMTYTWAGNAASGNAYRIRPIGALGGGVPNFQPANPRPAAAPNVGGSLRVAGMNLLNFFNTFDGLPDTVDNCTNGVGGAATDCRGADTQAEFDRQWPKTIAAILALNPDVLGVNEIENDGYGPTSAIQFLTDKLNAATAPGTYAFIDVDTATGQTNALGTDAIKVAMLYKPARVTPVGQTAALNSTAFVNGGDSAPRSRPSLAQAFEENATGARFILDLNHLKSKGSPCDAPDAGDGQGNCNTVRTNAANQLTAWLASNPTGTGETDILLLGDYNSYAKEDPITAIKSAGYTNLIEQFLGADAYSYVFDGQWGYLDHALGSASIVGQVSGVGDYHINADEPSVLDYNTDFKTANLQSTLYAPDQFRVSDHDPVLVGLSLTVPNSPPVASDQSVTTAEDTPASITLVATDANAGDTLSYSVVAGPAHGSLSGTGASLTYTPAANYNGPDSFTFKANDGTADSNVATVTITVTPVNDAPVASDQSVTTAEDTPASITLSANDVEGDSLTYSVVAGPAHGSLSGTGASLTYTPAANYNGPDSFTFKANDGTTDSNIATVTIDVTAVNDAPAITIVPGGQCLADFQGLANLALADADGTGSLTLSASSSNTTLVPVGNVTFGGSAGARTVTIATAAGKTGSATVTISVSDGTSSASLTISVKAGGSGGDVLLGTGGADMLFGGNGVDQLLGGSGIDLLCGGGGVDQLFGGNGDDALDGGSGNDQLFGDDGNDTLTGGSGNDQLFGGSGNDQLLGGDGNDLLTGGSGADHFDGGPNFDIAIDYQPSQGDTRVNIP